MELLTCWVPESQCATFSWVMSKMPSFKSTEKPYSRGGGQYEGSTFGSLTWGFLCLTICNPLKNLDSYLLPSYIYVYIICIYIHIIYIRVYMYRFSLMWI